MNRLCLPQSVLPSFDMIVGSDVKHVHTPVVWCPQWVVHPGFADVTKECAESRQATCLQANSFKFWCDLLGREVWQSNNGPDDVIDTSP